MEKKILIADDEVHIRMLLEQTLESLEDEGVEFLFADNGAAALSLIQTMKPQLVFLDVMMPKMNGMEVCVNVRNDPNLRDIYIVLLTAKGQEMDRQKGSEAGADQYMTKPFDPDQVLEMARMALELK